MKEILRYLYTGKLRLELNTLMGIIKLASFLGLDQVTKSCKTYLFSPVLNAFDLCILYCEIRDDATDFEDMRKLLCDIIPEKVDGEILCRVLTEIWVD